jgi:hypothetical protein
MPIYCLRLNTRDFTEVGTDRGDVTVAKGPSSIERIQRLEKLERERLNEKERKEEQRRLIIAGVKPSGGRHDLVDRIERATKYPMALLGMAWLALPGPDRRRCDPFPRGLAGAAFRGECQGEQYPQLLRRLVVGRRHGERADRISRHSRQVDARGEQPGPFG